MDSKKHSVLVDYGCGTKPYRDVFASCVEEHVGLDFGPAQGPVDHALLDDGTSTLPAGMADIVLSTQVLEHVPNPHRYLNEAWRLLREDGLLVLSTHGHMIYHPVPDDYWRWTHQGLRKQVADCGFEIVELSGAIGIAATGAQFVLDGIRTSLPRPVRGAFNLLMQGVIWLLDMLAPGSTDRDASVFLLVAKKESDRSDPESTHES